MTRYGPWSRAAPTSTSPAGPTSSGRSSSPSSTATSTWRVYLLDHGADPIAPRRRRRPAVGDGRDAVAPARGRRPGRPPGEGHPPRADARAAGSGADPNARLAGSCGTAAFTTTGSARGATPFWRAAKANDVEAMRLLVAGGANPNIPSLEGHTPRWPRLASAGLRTCTDRRRRPGRDGQALPRAGHEIDATDAFSYTAFHGAAYRGDSELVKFMVGKGAGWIPGPSSAPRTDMANGFAAYSSLPRVHPETVSCSSTWGHLPLRPSARACPPIATPPP